MKIEINLPTFNCNFDTVQEIGRQLRELLQKMNEMKFPAMPATSIFQSEADKALVEQGIKSSNEYFQRETLKRKNPNER